MSHIAHKAGFQRHVLNRVDPFVKDQLARRTALQFRRRQEFLKAPDDGQDLFSHLMPYSYQSCQDCGPVPEVSLRLIRTS